jgi:hypothetical protein
MKIELTLHHEKSTKGTFVYGTAEPGAAVTTIYIRKAALGTPPVQLFLTLTDGAEPSDGHLGAKDELD